jgi:predicted nucleotidyltransferase
MYSREVTPREKVILLLKKASEEIIRLIPLDTVILYGSYANGTPKYYSDVDLAVVSPEFGKDIINEAVKLMELYESTGLMVEPRAYSRQEFQESGPGTFLHEEVVKKGIRIL